MADPLVLSIDQGTSSTKSLLVDRAGMVVARGAAALGEQRPRPGWVEQDANEIRASVRESVRLCLDGQEPTAVVAIGLSTQHESLVMWDRRTGEPLSPVISWQDQRTGAIYDALRSPSRDVLVRQRSGLPLDPMFSALKAKWLLDALDPDRSRAKVGEICLGTIDSWLLAAFGTEHLIEVGNASRTQLLHVERGAWDEDLLDLFGVPEPVLPRVLPSVGPFPSVRALEPLPDGVPIHAVMGDSHSALFAHGAFAPGQVKATFGTGSSVMGLIEKPEHFDPGLCLTVGWSVERPAYAAEGNIRAAGATLRWAADLLGMTIDELADLAAVSRSDGVALVPGFTGLGAPWWDRNAVGLLSGFTLGSGRGQIARAALESIAHQVDDVVAAIDRSVGRVGELYADGGPTRNATLMQLQADLLGRPVRRAHTTELSALGAAHLAGLSAGVWSWDDLKALARERDSFGPGIGDVEREHRRRAWHDAVARARGSSGSEPQSSRAA